MKTRKSQTKSTLIALLFFLLFCSIAQNAGTESTKIAVAAIGQEKDAAISLETGRAPFFLIFDGKANFLEAIDNPAKYQNRGLRKIVSSLFAQEGITIIIAGNIGSKMEQALKEQHIQYIQKTGVAANAVQAFIQNR
ncbi:MAG: NifB/NifX family molybdenum-iron cluster-binding protein [Pseudomonadota bacterium]|nr:NifB/NifX family molybdenum-iron cluster-binding protein [Pseudomonadota bacterium]